MNRTTPAVGFISPILTRTEAVWHSGRCEFAGSRVGSVSVGSMSDSCISVRLIGVPNRRARSIYMQLASPSTKIGRPKTSIKKNIGTSSTAKEPETETGKGAAKARPKRKTQADEIPMFKVILLGHEEYEEVHVVTQLQKTIGLDKKEAQRVFMEAQSTGSSIACVVCEEHAEFYAQQLRRQEIYVVVEKDE